VASIARNDLSLFPACTVTTIHFRHSQVDTDITTLARDVILHLALKTVFRQHHMSVVFEYSLLVKRVS